MQSSIIFIDQPAGVGFSYGKVSDYDKNEAQVSKDMYNFLEVRITRTMTAFVTTCSHNPQAFFDANPKFRGNDFFVFGESYAGKCA